MDGHSLRGEILLIICCLSSPCLFLTYSVRDLLMPSLYSISWQQLNHPALAKNRSERCGFACLSLPLSWSSHCWCFMCVCVLQVLVYVCGSKEKYRLVRDKYALRSYLQKIRCSSMLLRTCFYCISYHCVPDCSLSSISLCCFFSF